MSQSEIFSELKKPFMLGELHWHKEQFNEDKTLVLVRPLVTLRGIQDRLNRLCADTWGYQVEMIAPQTIRGRLTIAGVSRDGIGERDDIKRASASAFIHSAELFGIGNYLRDLAPQWLEWDDQNQKYLTQFDMPDEALAVIEASEAGRHLTRIMEDLKQNMPNNDLDKQREMYKHLKGALQIINPSPQMQRRESC